jgi:hypothetical protein
MRACNPLQRGVSGNCALRMTCARLCCARRLLREQILNESVVILDTFGTEVADHANPWAANCIGPSLENNDKYILTNDKP